MKKKLLIPFLILVFSLSALSACSPSPYEVDDDIYSITFEADGQTVETVRYSANSKKIKVPAVPVKENFSGEWEDFTLEYTANQVVKAVYYATMAVEFNTSCFYDKDGNQIMARYIESFSSITVIDGGSWNLPLLKNCDMKDGIIVYACEDLSWIYLDGDEKKTIDVNNPIDLSQYNKESGLTLYIRVLNILHTLVEEQV